MNIENKYKQRQQQKDKFQRNAINVLNNVPYQEYDYRKHIFSAHDQDLTKNHSEKELDENQLKKNLKEIIKRPATANIQDYQFNKNKSHTRESSKQFNIQTENIENFENIIEDSVEENKDYNILNKNLQTPKNNLLESIFNQVNLESTQKLDPKPENIKPVGLLSEDQPKNEDILDNWFIQQVVFMKKQNFKNLKEDDEFDEKNRVKESQLKSKFQQTDDDIEQLLDKMFQQQINQISNKGQLQELDIKNIMESKIQQSKLINSQSIENNKQSELNLQLKIENWLKNNDNEQLDMWVSKKIQNVQQVQPNVQDQVDLLDGIQQPPVLDQVELLDGQELAKHIDVDFIQSERVFPQGEIGPSIDLIQMMDEWLLNQQDFQKNSQFLFDLFVQDQDISEPEQELQQQFEQKLNNLKSSKQIIKDSIMEWFIMLIDKKQISPDLSEQQEEHLRFILDDWKQDFKRRQPLYKDQLINKVIQEFLGGITRKEKKYPVDQQIENIQLNKSNINLIDENSQMQRIEIQNELIEDDEFQFFCFFKNIFEIFSSILIVLENQKQVILQKLSDNLGHASVSKLGYRKQFEYYYIGTSLFKKYRTRVFDYPQNLSAKFDLPEEFYRMNFQFCFCSKRILLSEQPNKNDYMIQEIANQKNWNVNQSLNLIQQQFKFYGEDVSLPPKFLKNNQLKQNKQSEIYNKIKQIGLIENGFDDFLKDLNQIDEPLLLLDQLKECELFKKISSKEIEILFIHIIKNTTKDSYQKMMKFIVDYPDPNKSQYNLFRILLPNINNIDDWILLFNLWTSNPELFDNPTEICEEFQRFRQLELNKSNMDCIFLVNFMINCDKALLSAKHMSKNLRIDLLNDNINFLKEKLKSKLNSTQNLPKIVYEFEQIKQKKRKENYYELLNELILQKFNLNHLNEIEVVLQQFIVIKSESFKPIISDFLLLHRKYIFRDEFFMDDLQVQRIFSCGQNLQGTQFYEQMCVLINFYWGKMQSDYLTLFEIKKIIDNINLVLNYFLIIGIDQEQYYKQLQNLQLKYTNFVGIRDKVIHWIGWHQSMMSVGIPDRIKRIFLGDENVIQLSEAVEIVEFIQNFIQNIEILYFFKQDNELFNQIVKNNYDQIYGKSFDEIETFLLDPILKELNDICLSLFSHLNPSFQFDESVRKWKVIQQLTKLNKKALIFSLLKKNFNLVYILNQEKMNFTLINIQQFYSLLEVPNAVFNKNSFKDLITYFDIHIVYSRCKSIEKISKFFSFFDDNSVVKYKKILNNYQLLPGMTINEVIKNKSILKDFQVINTDFTDEQLYFIFLFSKILKIIQLIISNNQLKSIISKKLNRFEKIIKILENNYTFLIDLNETMKIHKNFQSFFTNLIPKIQNKVQILQELISIKKYILAIEDLLQVPSNHSDQTLTTITKIVQKGRYQVQTVNYQFIFFVELNNMRIDVEELHQQSILLKQLGNTQEIDAILLQFTEQINILKHICALLLDLKLNGHQDYQEWTKSYDNFNNSISSIEQMKSDLTLLQQQKKNWTETQNSMFSKYPFLTLIPTKYYKNFEEFLDQNSITNQEEFQDLFFSIHESLELNKLTVLKQKFPDLFSRIGEFLNLNLKNVLVLLPLPPESQESLSIYMIKFLESEQKLIIQQLVASINLNSRGFQYFFCQSDSSYQDIELFINRFLFMQIRREFYLINLQRTPTSTKNRVFSLLKQLFRSKLNCSNKLILIYEIKSNNDWTGVQFLQYKENKKQEHSQLILKSSRVYTSEYAGLGKSYQISKNSSKQLRVPLHNTYTPQEIINLLKSKKIRQNCDSIHLEITDSDNYHELDLLMFQIIVLRVLRVNNFDLIQIPSKIKFDIEIQNTINDKLRNNLHLIQFFEEKIHLKYDLQMIDINQEINKPMQRSLRYLNALRFSKDKKAQIDFGQGYKEASGKPVPLIDKVEGKKLLREFFFNKIKKPNLYTLMFFIRFFGKQMKLLDASPFFSVYLAEDRIKIQDLRHDIIKLIYDVSLSQSIQSGGIEGDLYNHQVQNFKQGEDNQKINQKIVQIVQKLTKFSDLQSDFVAFTTEGTIVSCFRDKLKMPPVLLQMYQLLQEQGLETEIPDLSTENQTALVKWLIHLCNKIPSDVFKVYNATTFKESQMPISLQNKLNELAISSDNFYKMALIYLRILTKMPAIPLGETGIGKTALIELLSKIMSYQFIKLDVHAGLSKESIINTVTYANSIACKENKILLFLDEINTNNNINGLLKELVVDHLLEGSRINKHVVVLATCNPYKIKSNISDTLTTGLRNRYLKQEYLVYRVLPMPESMFYFVWNYDSLNIKDEIFYIKKIIQCQGVFNSQEINNCIVEQVFLSQQFIRECQNQWSCSLRDVKRFSVLSQWFVQVYFIKKQEAMAAAMGLQEVKTRSLILSLSFCYHIRLQSEHMRRMYREYIMGIFKLNSQNHSLCLQNELMQSSDPFQQVINEEYEFLINCLQSPQDIGRNISIKENIFVMFVCLFNKIPLILTGPPGSSKSISFSLIKNSLKGQKSQNNFIKLFQKIKAFYHQGHLQSTSQQIESLFKQAIFKQTQYEEKKIEKMVVVFIDEIGLAEISPHNPLKILHSLLEHPQISVLGISNWALDASKMNRAIHLSRHPLSKMDLIFTAGCILQEMGFELKQMTYYIEKIVIIYINFLKIFSKNHKKDGIYGLRDFYNLIKFICSEWNSNSNQNNQLDIIFLSFQRNFGGYDQNYQIIQQEFQASFNQDGPPSPIIENLIIYNLKEKKSKYMTRNLMIFTEDIESATFFVNKQLKGTCKIFFGSDFKDDTHENHIYSIIRNLTLCIETGIPSIIINLKEIYECFYDMLNQNYLEKDRKKICRITYFSFSSWIQVHENFKFIIIANFADRDMMEEPFLNRFEKHEFSNVQTMNSLQLEVYTYLTEFIEKISQTCDIKEDEIFCFSNSNTFISSIVTEQNCEDLQNNCLKRLISMSHFETAIKINDQNYTNIYFKEQQHLNLCDYLINQKQIGLQYSIVYSFQSIQSNQLDVLKDFDLVGCIIYLQQIDSQKQLQDEINKFVSDDVNNILLVVSDLLIDSYQKITLARSYLDSSINQNKLKSICLIIRMIEKQCKALHSQLNWDQICIENLFDPFPQTDFIEFQEIKYILDINNLINHPLNFILSQKDSLILKYFLLQKEFIVSVLLQTNVSLENLDEIMDIFINYDSNSVVVNGLIVQSRQIMNKFSALIHNDNNWYLQIQKDINVMSFHQCLIQYLRQLALDSYITLFTALFQKFPGMPIIQILTQKIESGNYQIIQQKYPFIYKDLQIYYNNFTQLDIDNEKKKYIMFQLRDFGNKYDLYNKLTQLIKIINYRKYDPEIHIYQLMVRYWLVKDGELKEILKDLHLNQLLNLLEVLEYEMMDRFIDSTDQFSEVIYEDQSEKLVQFINECSIDIDQFIIAIGRYFIRKLIRDDFDDNPDFLNQNLMYILLQEGQCWDFEMNELVQQSFQKFKQFDGINIKVNQAYYTYWALLTEKDEHESRKLQLNNNQII